MRGTPYTIGAVDDLTDILIVDSSNSVPVANEMVILVVVDVIVQLSLL